MHNGSSKFGWFSTALLVALATGWGCVSEDSACLPGDELVDGRCQGPAMQAADASGQVAGVPDEAAGESGSDIPDTAAGQDDGTGVGDSGGDQGDDDDSDADTSSGADSGSDSAEVMGCTSEQATNYNPNASSDDGSCTWAVYFSVDMTFFNLAADDVVYLNGSMNEWCGDCLPMADEDGDGIWSVSIPLRADYYEYRFTVNGWEDQEVFEVGGACDSLPDDEFANRGFDVISEPVTLPTTCYGVCGPCPEVIAGCTDTDATNYSDTASQDDGSCLYAVSLAVDARYAGLDVDDVVYLNGTMNDWCGDCNPMADEDGDGVWTIELSLSPGNYEYRYTVNGWSAEESIPLDSACDFTPGDEYLSRGFIVVAEPLDFTSAPVCYSECQVCSEEAVSGCTDSAAANFSSAATADDGSCVYAVTFSVDMSMVSLASEDVVHINGGFNSWCGDCTPMSDEDADGVWAATLDFAPGVYEYRFTINGWTLAEEIGTDSSCDYTPGDEFANRGFEVTNQALVLATPCYSSCESCE